MNTLQFTYCSAIVHKKHRDKLTREQILAKIGACAVMLKIGTWEKYYTKKRDYYINLLLNRP